MTEHPPEAGNWELVKWGELRGVGTKGAADWTGPTHHEMLMCQWRGKAWISHKETKMTQLVRDGIWALCRVRCSQAHTLTHRGKMFASLPRLPFLKGENILKKEDNWSLFRNIRPYVSTFCLWTKSFLGFHFWSGSVLVSGSGRESEWNTGENEIQSFIAQNLQEGPM